VQGAVTEGVIPSRRSSWLTGRRISSAKRAQKQFGCWQWQSGKIIFSYVEDNQQRGTIEETFDDTWLDFTTAWYKEDWPHSSGY